MTTDSDRYGNRPTRFADLPHEVNWQVLIELRQEAKRKAEAESNVIPIRPKLAAATADSEWSNKALTQEDAA